jgi:hypothetical protein
MQLDYGGCGERLSTHLLSDQYLGAETIEELAGTWYRTSTFAIHMIQHMEVVLQVNAWDL